MTAVEMSNAKLMDLGYPLNPVGVSFNLLAYICWPNEEQAHERVKLKRSLILRFLATEQQSIRPGQSRDKVVLDLAKTLSELPQSPEDMDVALAKIIDQAVGVDDGRLWQALNAGYLLYQVLAMHLTPNLDLTNGASVAKARTLAIAETKYAWLKSSQSSLESLWSEFKPVAHLAAAIFFRAYRSTELKDPDWLITIYDTPDITANLSLSFLLFAKSFVPHSNKTMLFHDVESLLPPIWLAGKPCGIEIPNLLPHEVAALSVHKSKIK
ncbi:hypothetical protein [Pelagibius sp. Alg239-R121]|uniref:hypothetical protein n=1 Tax=Pelagibius sp. Alg239-R121 TaxID=2993448 RepID=UPI0024A6B6CD|nr:hypothetical protein [Pelagibius sp. Alg239-R121]